MHKVRFVVVTIIASICTLNVQAQVSRGIIQKGLIIKSDILKKDVRYTVYLPFDYSASSRYYPVVYLLHGYGDNDMGWVQFGEANMIADESIATRQIPAMILVMPDGGVSWYINNFDNSVRYEDFFFEEFIPFIESKYRIRPEKRYRGVAGLSMGGFGAMVFYPLISRAKEIAVFIRSIFNGDNLAINNPIRDFETV
jgi:enterochelin esterase-like enzyme